ncbi:MAG: hypothetical protein J2P58_13135 [Acidimicrobiaceae bacterium]|nr:hypothetical protein [Acidimicrobiaceae bacterium]
MSDTSNRPGWPGVGGIIACHPGTHSLGPTVLDERARRLSHQELAMAELLASEGHRVVSLAERRGSGPVPDLAVCRRPVEIKSFDALADRLRGAPTEWSVCNKLLGARTQAPTVILCGRGSGLSEEAARQGVAEFAGRGRVGRVRGVRVVGDGFDLSWSLRLVRDVGVTAIPVASSGRAAALGESVKETTRLTQQAHQEMGR